MGGGDLNPAAGPKKERGWERGRKRKAEAEERPQSCLHIVEAEHEARPRKRRRKFGHRGLSSSHHRRRRPPRLPPRRGLRSRTHAGVDVFALRDYVQDDPCTRASELSTCRLLSSPPSAARRMPTPRPPSGSGGQAISAASSPQARPPRRARQPPPDLRSPLQSLASNRCATRLSAACRC